MEFVGMPALQILLVAIIFLSLLVEIKTGGMGLGAMLGLVAAGIFFSGQYVKGLVSFLPYCNFPGRDFVHYH